ncbi:MAG: sulfite exporter TauE/SafE, partial [Cyclobacteriaceae bacterium]
MIWSGFVIGLLGSLHCVGMCGPLAFAAPTMSSKRLTGALVYNAGRTMTYAVLGAIAGILGLGINLAGFQSYLSIAT